MRLVFILLTICFLQQTTMAQVPKVVAGTITHYEQMPSKYVGARNVDVWLPEGYSTSKKYAVLYMHDGKALFDSSIMWNHQAWQVDKVASQLMQSHQIKECIVVGIYNGETKRHSEYFPQKPFKLLTLAQQDSIYKATRGATQPLFADTIQSDNYLKFIVKELKPFIDSHFATLKNSANTFIAGSSMGGLISMYAICEYPNVFGGAACLSTHWTGIFRADNNPIPAAFMAYMRKHLPSPKKHKIYFDYGSATLDALYKPFQLQVDTIMQQKGYNTTNWLTKEYIGADHSERSWNKRLDVPLLFLLGK
jgi:enterochelin esterase-like enzyme